MRTHSPMAQMSATGLAGAEKLESGRRKERSKRPKAQKVIHKNRDLDSPRYGCLVLSEKAASNVLLMFSPCYLPRWATSWSSADFSLFSGLLLTDSNPCRLLLRLTPRLYQFIFALQVPRNDLIMRRLEK